MLGAVAMLVAGCQVPPARLAAAAAKPPSAASSAQANPAPTVAPKSVVLAATPAAAQVDADNGPALRLTGDPKELVGLDHAAIRRALGDPVRIRNDRPAQVWQYATGDCIVDLYLYSSNGVMKVTFVEARSHTAETAPAARCLKSLLERPTASADY